MDYCRSLQFYSLLPKAPKTLGPLLEKVSKSFVQNIAVHERQEGHELLNRG